MSPTRYQLLHPASFGKGGSMPFDSVSQVPDLIFFNFLQETKNES